MSAFVVLALVSSVPCQVIGWEYRLQNDRLLCREGHETLTQLISQSIWLRCSSYGMETVQVTPLRRTLASSL